MGRETNPEQKTNSHGASIVVGIPNGKTIERMKRLSALQFTTKTPQYNAMLFFVCLWWL
jgi:hypothetical protein